METFFQIVANRPMQSYWTTWIREHYPAWFLKTDNGKPAVFWIGMRMMNISSSCPKVNGQTYGDWMASFLLKSVLSDDIWDGYFMDNGGGNISWVYGDRRTKIDADNNSVADNDSLLDKSWSEGVHSFLKKIREVKGKKFIILANKGSKEFMDVLNGRMFETFPCDYLGDKKDGGWWQGIKNSDKTGKYTVFQVIAEDLEFGLASALLKDNVSIAVGQDNPKFYPILETKLGKALGKMKILKGKVCRRNFQNGYVTVIPSRREGKIKLYKK
jgi:hypothetical protein